MTREEAARVLEGMMEDYRISSCDDDWYYGENLEALETAISALREKAGRGCACCVIGMRCPDAEYCSNCGRKLTPTLPELANESEEVNHD